MADPLLFDLHVYGWHRRPSLIGSDVPSVESENLYTRIIGGVNLAIRGTRSTLRAGECFLHCLEIIEVHGADQIDIARPGQYRNRSSANLVFPETWHRPGERYVGPEIVVFERFNVNRLFVDRD
jgi:hypothetical protein